MVIGMALKTLLSYKCITAIYCKVVTLPRTVSVVTI